MPSITFPLKVPLPEQMMEMLSGLLSSCFIVILICLHRLFKYSMSMNAVANPLADTILRLMVDFLFFVTDIITPKKEEGGLFVSINVSICEFCQQRHFWFRLPVEWC